MVAESNVDSLDDYEHMQKELGTMHCGAAQSDESDDGTEEGDNASCASDEPWW